MSVHWYKQLATAEQRTRSVICGHPIRVRSSLYDLHIEIPCPACGREQAVHGNVPRDCVPTPSLGWLGAEKTKTRILSTDKRNSAKVTSLEQLCAQVTANNVPRIDLHSQDLKLENSISAHITTKFIVWRASPHGCGVHSGTVHIPKGSTLLLDGFGAHFNTVKFSGGSVVCTGAEYSGTFRNCTFDTCPLYAVHGAAVTLSHCTLTGGVPALVASGPGTSVALRRCHVHSDISGITVEAGATLRAASVSLRGLAHGVYMFINDPGSRAALRDSVLSGPRGRVNNAFGAFVQGGALSLLRCQVSCIRMAVYALAASTVEVRGGFMEDCGWGVTVVGGGHTLVRDVDISLMNWTDEWGAYPIAVALGKRLAPEGAAGQVERCTMYGSVAHGMHVSYGAKGAMQLCHMVCAAGGASVESERSRVTVADCYIGDSDECCKVASAGCAMRVERCEMQGRNGACVASGGSLSIADSKLRGCAEAVQGVVAAVDSAALVLLRCAVAGSGLGVRVMHAAARVVDTSVSDVVSRFLARAPADGVPVCCGSGYACVGGNLVVTGGALENCVVGAMVREGPGGKHGSVEMQRVTLRSYIVGVRGYEGSEVALMDCEFTAGKCGSRDLVPMENVGPGAGFETAVILHDSDSGRVERCRFEGHWCDIAARTRQPTIIRDCVHESAAPKSSCIRVEAETVVEGCRFSGVEQGVSCEAASCTVRRCEFGPGVRESAIRAMQSGRAMAIDCSVTDSKVALHVQDQGSVHAQDCIFTRVERGCVLQGGGCSAAAKRVQMRGGACFVHAATCSASKPTVKLVECSISDCEHTGVYLAGASGMLLRCDILRCAVGISLQHAASARVRNSLVSGGGSGFLVAAASATAACGICERAGDASLEAARRALRAAEGGEQPRARCAHEGAPARLQLEGVEVVDCREEGLRVGPLGLVDASDVLMRGCRRSVSVESLVERSQFRNCSAEHAAPSPAEGGAKPVEGWRYEWEGAEKCFVRRPEAVPGIDVVTPP